MEQSHKLADFLEDMDIDYDIFLDDFGGVFVEFTFDNMFYEVGFSESGELTVNGEPSTYKEFITNTF